MFKELQKEVYTKLRDDAGLTQTELATASGISRRSLQRVETAERLPTAEEEEAILMGADCTVLSFAEVLCKVLGEKIGRRVKIVADEVGYQAATPEGELVELMSVAYEKMPQDRWWAWKERVGRYKALGQLYEAQGFADVRDLAAEVKALLAEEEPTGRAPDKKTAAGGENKERKDTLAFPRPVS